MSGLVQLLSIAPAQNEVRVTVPTDSTVSLRAVVVLLASENVWPKAAVVASVKFPPPAIRPDGAEMRT